ncbi:MAG: hypothetical protein ABJF10_08005 [Chthoniobacter sp.]|uniref:hypothetical protein n=1 Tax=Chthoniobacter sp. TaxID=2510640 RepID=UPI0032A62B85
MSSSIPSPTPNRHCQACGTKPANNFLCQIINGEQTNLELCDECLREHSAGTGLELPSLDGTRCFYCGGAANGGGPNAPHEMASRRQRFHYTCLRCGELSAQWMVEAIGNLPEGLSLEMQSGHFEKIVREVDERVRYKIRSNPN